MSNEALCIIAGLKPIHTKIKNRGSPHNNQRKQLYELTNRPRQTPHSMPSPSIQCLFHRRGQHTSKHNPHKHLQGWKQVGTGSRSRYIHKKPRTTTVEIMYKMDTRCANNQAEAFAILKGVGIRTNRLGKRRGQSNKSVYS